ncbi:hypothetical protein ACJX0J_037544, partial [Zea mays]
HKGAPLSRHKGAPLYKPSKITNLIMKITSALHVGAQVLKKPGPHRRAYVRTGMMMKIVFKPDTATLKIQLISILQGSSAAVKCWSLYRTIDVLNTIMVDSELGNIAQEKQHTHIFNQYWDKTCTCSQKCGLIKVYMRSMYII